MPRVAGKPKRTNHQICQDKAIIADLSLKGYTQQMIAEEINQRYREAGTDISITVSSVNKDLKQINKEWKESAIMDVNEYKIMQLKKLDALESEYWMSWQKSINSSTKKTISKKIIRKGSEDIVHKEQKEEDFFGDPRFLDGINKCIQQRCGILGLSGNDDHAAPVGLIITIDESSISSTIS